MGPIKRIALGVVAVLAVVGVVAAWPNLELILTIAAAVLVVGFYAVAVIWTDRRRRRGEEASTADPNTMVPPMQGWSSGGGMF